MNKQQMADEMNRLYSKMVSYNAKLNDTSDFEWEWGMEVAMLFQNETTVKKDLRGNKGIFFKDLPVKINSYDGECLKLWKQIE